jgi:hypothetical protein
MTCEYCEQPLDMDENGMPYQVILHGVGLPGFAAHDICEAGDRYQNRENGLHKLYCHLEDCDWELPKWRRWKR